MTPYEESEGWEGSAQNAMASNPDHAMIYALLSVSAAVRGVIPVTKPTPPPMPTLAKREEMVAAIRKEMAHAVRGLIGSGYVPDYYADLASDFAQVAERTVDDVLAGVWS